MTTNRKPSNPGPMTRETAVVYIATELLRYPLNDDLQGLHRESVVLTMLDAETIAGVVFWLASTFGELMKGVGTYDINHDFLDQVMLGAQFDQLTNRMALKEGNPE